MPLFYNKATLSYNNKITDSNVVTGELVEVLNAAKNAIGNEYRSGDSVTYVISMVNSGTTAFTGLTITDNLGRQTQGDVTITPLTYEENSVRYFSNGILQAAPTVSDETSLVITGINVPAGGNVLVIYKATVNPYAPLFEGGTIENQAVITGVGLTAPIEVTSTIEAANSADLTISKSLCPESVVENSQVTYTFVIQNSGNKPATAEDNVVVTDIFQPILNPIAVTFNNTVWVNSTNYTYNTVTGEFATVAGQITVPAATYRQDEQTGIWTVIPGISVLKITGTISSSSATIAVMDDETTPSTVEA